MAIQALSPTRVDLAGGTLDINPLTRLLSHVKTINFGITLHAGVEIEKSTKYFNICSVDQKIASEGTFLEVTRANKLPWLEKLLEFFWEAEWPPIKIKVEAKSPSGAGLGGSSCLGIALASALLKARQDIGQGLILSEHQLVQIVQDLETSLIRVPTGCQDYWGGLRGGINIISYPPGKVHIQTLRGEQGSELKNLLLLCYSGVSRASGTNNWAIFRRAFDGDFNTLSLLGEIGELSEALADSVLACDWREVFRLSSLEWALRKKLWSDIETPETMKIAAAAANAPRSAGPGWGPAGCRSVG
jgi:D-glycero-alpha-D-manno-heptose-7-phosphate kinase